MTVEIPLTQGMAALVDDEDAERVLAQGKWYAHRNRHAFYALRMSRRPDGSRQTIGLHTFLTGWPLVDHINGDGLDNRRANLRPATDTENRRNARRRTDNTSGFRGVHWHKARGTWRARISVDGQRVCLGYHPTADAAARAYDAAALVHHGEFAHLNFPGEVNA